MRIFLAYRDCPYESCLVEKPGEAGPRGPGLALLRSEIMLDQWIIRSAAIATTAITIAAIPLNDILPLFFLVV
jgi:hypothetical protein